MEYNDNKIAQNEEIERMARAYHLALNKENPNFFCKNSKVEINNLDPQDLKNYMFCMLNHLKYIESYHKYLQYRQTLSQISKLTESLKQNLNSSVNFDEFNFIEIKNDYCSVLKNYISCLTKIADLLLAQENNELNRNSIFIVLKIISLATNLFGNCKYRNIF